MARPLRSHCTRTEPGRADQDGILAVSRLPTFALPMTRTGPRARRELGAGVVVGRVVDSAAEDQSGSLAPGSSRRGWGPSQSPATSLIQTPSGSCQASDWESGDQVGLAKPVAVLVAHSAVGTGTVAPVRTSP